MKTGGLFCEFAYIDFTMRSGFLGPVVRTEIGGSTEQPGLPYCDYSNYIDYLWAIYMKKVYLLKDTAYDLLILGG